MAIEQGWSMRVSRSGCGSVGLCSDSFSFFFNGFDTDQELLRDDKELFHNTELLHRGHLTLGPRKRCCWATDYITGAPTRSFLHGRGSSSKWHMFT